MTETVQLCNVCAGRGCPEALEHLSTVSLALTEGKQCSMFEARGSTTIAANPLSDHALPSSPLLYLPKGWHSESLRDIPQGVDCVSGVAVPPEQPQTSVSLSMWPGPEGPKGRLTSVDKV